MHPLALEAAAPTLLEDGTLFSPRFGDVYASAAGALEETRHVFLTGNGLPDRWRGRRSFVIVETGFGTGLNFLATWEAWRKSAAPDARLHFLSVERHPLRRADLARMQTFWPELRMLAGELITAYPPLVPGFHRLHFEGGRVTLTLLLGDAVDMLRKLEARADAFYLDGFAPARNPEMWNDDVMRELARLAQPEATAATYSVAGAVRHGLAAAGFVVERREGFGRKREMLVVRFASAAVRPSSPAGREAIVVGAGLAGTSCAAQLATRGWRVQLIERRGEVAQEASGNPSALMMPAFSLDWNPPTRLTMQSFLYAVRWLDTLTGAGHAVSERSGILQLGRDEAHVERQRRIVEAFNLPGELVQLVGRDEGSEIAGARVAGAGWWLPTAQSTDPASVCRANLVAGTVETLFARDAARFRRVGEHWEVLDGYQNVLARAPVLILANAYAAAQFPGCEHLPLAMARGQLTLVAQRSGAALNVPVCREGFITPASGGHHCVGASYSLDREANARVEDHAGNLERLERILPGFGAGLDPSRLGGRVGFRTVSPDRMPLVGPLVSKGHDDGHNGLFACVGLASRGLTWAPLLAETVACLVAGEPPPLERDLLRFVDPGRFARRE